jgi:hypothetical protein
MPHRPIGASKMQYAGSDKLLVPPVEHPGTAPSLLKNDHSVKAAARGEANAASAL